MQGATGPCRTTHSATSLRSTTHWLRLGREDLGLAGRSWQEPRRDDAKNHDQQRQKAQAQD
jgi:hypothetical protein